MVEPLSLRERAILRLYRREEPRRSRPPALPTQPPERRWWDLSAKVAAAKEIELEEKARHMGHHNDHEDGMRHAEWSRRTAERTGPVFSAAAGIAHEIDNSLWQAVGGDGLPLSEAAMDLANNFEGLRASAENRPVDPARIRNRPISVRAALRRRMQP